MSATETTTEIMTGMSTSVAKADLSKYRAEVDEMVKAGEEIEITDEASNQKAAGKLTDCKALIKKVEAKRVEIVKPHNGFVSTINNFAKTFAEPLTRLETLLKDKISRYNAQQELKRRQEEEELRKEAQRQQTKADEEARQAGVEPVEIPAPVIPIHKPITRTEGGTVTSRKKWTFQIADISKVPREYLIVDEKKIRNAIAAGIRKIEGITIYQEDNIIARSM